MEKKMALMAKQLKVLQDMALLEGAAIVILLVVLAIV